MSLFSMKKQNTEDIEDYSTLFLPFAQEQNKTDDITPSNVKLDETPKKNPAAQSVNLYPGGVSPLDALKKRMDTTVNVPIPENITPPVKETVTVKTAPVKKETPIAEPKKTTSLLKKCLPYIYDEEGVSQVDAKPDYVLESVDDIIRSAEKRANQKIAEKYKLKDKNGNSVNIEIEETKSKTEEIKQPENPPKTEPATPPKEDISLPKNAEVLFDDFSGKRTVVTPTESITTAYSKLTELHSGIPMTNTASTIVIPKFKNTKTETMDDIVSHTRPVNIKDAPAIKPQKPVSVAVKTDDLIPEVADDYRTPDDARRIGTSLKKSRRSAFFKAIISVASAIVSAIFVLVLPHDLFYSFNFVPSLVQFGLLIMCSVANINIFSSFKNIFTKRTSSAAPIALAITATVIYSVLGFISGTYASNHILLTIISIAAYDICLYKHETARLNNFRIVASKSEKKAVALIDDQNVTTTMARSSIEGEVLTTGIRRTSTLTDFLRFSSADSTFGSFTGTAILVFGILSLIVAVVIGVSHRSIDSALGSAAVMLSLFTMPTYSIAEFLPLNSISKRLYKLRAMICSKYSASRIEQANAVVVTSKDLFPDGSIELFNIKPLGSNNIDRTFSAAASVAEAVGSPLISVFKPFVDESEKRTAADTVKYEDNLGISGWVGDEHYFIGNRTLLEAHSIKVPPLEVDRKILHKGYFPVYVAVGQRACALLIVKYKPVASVRNSLVKLANAGMTLLIDNCDCNLTSEMLSDYYGIYEDSIKIMDHSGSQNYHSAVNFTEFYSAHAAFTGKTDGYFAIVNGALKLLKTSKLMYALHTVFAAISCLIFTLAALDGRMVLMDITVCILIEAVSLFLSLITFFIARR